MLDVRELHMQQKTPHRGVWSCLDQGEIHLSYTVSQTRELLTKDAVLILCPSDAQPGLGWKQDFDISDRVGCKRPACAEQLCLLFLGFHP